MVHLNSSPQFKKGSINPTCSPDLSFSPTVDLHTMDFEAGMFSNTPSFYREIKWLTPYSQRTYPFVGLRATSHTCDWAGRGTPQKHSLSSTQNTLLVALIARKGHVNNQRTKLQRAEESFQELITRAHLPPKFWFSYYISISVHRLTFLPGVTFPIFLILKHLLEVGKLTSAVF